MVVQRLLNQLPLGQNGKVFVGTAVICSICAIPLMGERPKPGHGIFDSQRPQEIEMAQEEERKKLLRRRPGSGKD
ncbi:unnamed protein product [Discosporangium mesarthrocarpum]